MSRENINGFTNKAHELKSTVKCKSVEHKPFQTSEINKLIQLGQQTQIFK